MYYAKVTEGFPESQPFLTEADYTPIALCGRYMRSAC